MKASGDEPLFTRNNRYTEAILLEQELTAVVEAKAFADEDVETNFAKCPRSRPGPKNERSQLHTSTF